MRILFVSSQYPPHELGGYEQLCLENAEGLQARGHAVHVLTSSYRVKSQEETHSGNVDRSLALSADIHYYRPVDFFLRWSSREKQNISELKRVIGQFAPDVILFWGMYALSHSLSFWAEKWMPGRTAYYIASYWPTDEDIHLAYWNSPANHQVTEWVKRPLRAAALNRMRKKDYPPELRLQNVICCSEYVRDTLAEAGKIPADSGVVYPGTDPQPFHFARAARGGCDPLRLLYFGRLVPDKGVHTAIEALGLLKEKEFAGRMELTILGDGHPDYKNLLQRKAAELGVRDRVQFIGKVDRGRIPEMLSNFDVFLFTSIWPEPFGRTIVEAMLGGLVVIGSDAGGSREIFREYDRDLLFQPGDAEALAERITCVLEDPSLRGRLAEAGRTLALEHFTAQQMTEGIENFLSVICGQASRESGG